MGGALLEGAGVGDERTKYRSLREIVSRGACLRDPQMVTDIWLQQTHPLHGKDQKKKKIPLAYWDTFKY